MVNGSGFSLDALVTKSRKRELVLTRQAIFYVLITNKLCSLNTAGALFNRDHATVLHAKRSVANILFTKYPKSEYLLVTNLIETAHAITGNSDMPNVQRSGNHKQIAPRWASRNKLGNYCLSAMRRTPGYAANNYGNAAASCPRIKRNEIANL